MNAVDMDKDRFEKVQNMILVEIMLRDLNSLCNDWGVKVDECVRFMKLARYGFSVVNGEVEI